MSVPILDWWGEKALSEVNKTSCDAYVTWRTAQDVSDQTARHELKTLRAAINHYHASAYGPLDAVPVVTLPAKAERKIDGGTRPSFVISTKNRAKLAQGRMPTASIPGATWLKTI